MPKFAVICFPEMGHFLPMIHIAEELKSRGHDVTFISCKYGEEKCRKYIEGIGCKALITQDSITREEMCPGADRKINPDSYKGFGMWAPFLKEALIAEKPDLCVIDFANVSAFEEADKLKIPVVMNVPAPVMMVQIMGLHYPE